MACNMTLNFSAKFCIFMDNQLKNSMERSPSRVTDIHSAGQEICYFLCDCVHRSLLLNPVLTRIMRYTFSHASYLIH
jgi:hypothetical protein